MTPWPNRKTVLLVEDSAYWADTISEALRGHGYSVSILRDGLTALEQLRAEPPRILVTDFFLANLDGGKLCQLAKGMRKTPPIATIILTGGADQKPARVAWQYADAVVAKNTADIVVDDLQRAMKDLILSLPPPADGPSVTGGERLLPRTLSSKLHGLKQYLDALHEGIGDAVIGIDRHLRVYFLNRTALELFDVTEQDALARPLGVILGVDRDHAMVGEAKQALADGGLRGPLAFEVNGTNLRVTVAGLKGPDGSDNALFIARDVTDLILAERERATLTARLHDADKMAALGHLAASISHEINNPLAALLPNLQILEDFVRSRSGGSSGSSRERPAPDPRDAQEAARESIEAANRTRAIVAEMREYYDAKRKLGKQVRVEDLLDSALSLVETEARFKATVERDYAAGTPSLAAAEPELSQAFVSIFINAVASTSGNDPSANTIAVRTRGADDGILVEIETSGTEVSENVPSTVFEFLHESALHAGPIGVNLALAYATVRRHGGYIEVQRGSNARVILRIWLPRNTGRALQHERPREAPYAVPRSRVLVVDDEKIVRNGFRRVLEQHHEVTLAASAERALALLENQAFDLILCDLIMPGMSGVDLYEEVCRRMPEHARGFVFLTGGTSVSGAREFLIRVDNPRAYKPLRADELEALVAESIGRLAREPED